MIIARNKSDLSRRDYAALVLPKPLSKRSPDQYPVGEEALFHVCKLLPEGTREKERELLVLSAR